MTDSESDTTTGTLRASSPPMRGPTRFGCEELDAEAMDAVEKALALIRKKIANSKVKWEAD